MIQEKGVVRRIDRFRPTLFSLYLELPEIAKSAEPGQFIHLKVNNVPGVLLRRPLSIAGVDGNVVKLIIHIVGIGTAALALAYENQLCDVIGPLGEGFDFKNVTQAYLIGGGIGDAPLLFLQDELLKSGGSCEFLIGARTRDLFPLEDKEIEKRSIIACTDDGSFGEHGFVTAVFEKRYSNDFDASIPVYSCGPVPMMKAASRICEKYNLPHQVSLENRMGCGVGVCQGCALKMAENGERGGYRLVCVDGPVFNAGDVDWDLIE
jgi:dihydroorotate dehydrogenase electron transfer subunit